MDKLVNVFWDSFQKYDALNYWLKTGSDAFFTSVNREFLAITKDNANNSANYISLRNPFRNIYNFDVEFDVFIDNAITYDNNSTVQLMNDTTTVLDFKASSGVFEFIDEDLVTIHNTGFISVRRWNRILIQQRFFNSGTTGEISVYLKNITDNEANWTFLGKNSTQSNPINNIRLGRIQSAFATFHIQFRNLLIKELITNEN